MASTIRRLTTSNVTAVKRIADGRLQHARTAQKLLRNNRKRRPSKRNSNKGRHLDSYC